MSPREEEQILVLPHADDSMDSEVSEEEEEAEEGMSTSSEKPKEEGEAAKEEKGMENSTTTHDERMVTPSSAEPKQVEETAKETKEQTEENKEVEEASKEKEVMDAGSGEKEETLRQEIREEVVTEEQKVEETAKGDEFLNDESEEKGDTPSENRKEIGETTKEEVPETTKEETKEVEIDYTSQDVVEQLLRQQYFQDGHCMKKEDLDELRDMPGNEVCIDCGVYDPDWASVNLGVFLCLECSGQHRALGTHISFVRSVAMDSWSEDQTQRMKSSGGNLAVVRFLKKHGLSKHDNIRKRYDCAAAMLWQQILDARLANRPEPTQLPDYVPRPPPKKQAKGIFSPASLKRLSFNWNKNNKPANGTSSSFIQGPPPPLTPTSSMEEKEGESSKPQEKTSSPKPNEDKEEKMDENVANEKTAEAPLENDSKTTVKKEPPSATDNNDSIAEADKDKGKEAPKKETTKKVVPPRSPSPWRFFVGETTDWRRNHTTDGAEEATENSTKSPASSPTTSPTTTDSNKEQPPTRGRGRPPVAPSPWRLLVSPTPARSNSTTDKKSKSLTSALAERAKDDDGKSSNSDKKDSSETTAVAKDETKATADEGDEKPTTPPRRKAPAVRQRSPSPWRRLLSRDTEVVNDDDGDTNVKSEEPNNNKSSPTTTPETAVKPSVGTEETKGETQEEGEKTPPPASDISPKSATGEKPPRPSPWRVLMAPRGGEATGEEKMMGKNESEKPKSPPKPEGRSIPPRSPSPWRRLLNPDMASNVPDIVTKDQKTEESDSKPKTSSIPPRPPSPWRRLLTPDTNASRGRSCSPSPNLLEKVMDAFVDLSSDE